jgi:hypothetical protein
MARNSGRDLTIEEFDDWVAAGNKVDAVIEAADEAGGPRLSLVPVPEQEDAWPTDLLPPIPPRNGEGNQPEAGGGAEPATPFDNVPLEDSRKSFAGWSAERQRLFLTHLAETGSVHLASSAARLSARGAYRLRTRSAPFARAWDAALQLSVGRLSAIAFDRAINGRIDQVYRDGALIAERRVPNDKMLMWLLARLDPKRFALPWEQRGDADPQAAAVAAFPGLLEAVTDTPS